MTSKQFGDRAHAEEYGSQGLTPLLSVRDLRVSFFLEEGVVRAVDGLSFDVFPGQVLGIVGESGCGKSVAMKAVLQLVEPPGRIVSGQILFRPAAAQVVDLTRLAPRGAPMRAIRGAEIALIPQEPMAAFSPVHSVGDHAQLNAFVAELSEAAKRPVERVLCD